MWVGQVHERIKMSVIGKTATEKNQTSHFCIFQKFLITSQRDIYNILLNQY